MKKLVFILIMFMFTNFTSANEKFSEYEYGIKKTVKHNMLWGLYSSAAGGVLTKVSFPTGGAALLIMGTLVFGDSASHSYKYEFKQESVYKMYRKFKMNLKISKRLDGVVSDKELHSFLLSLECSSCENEEKKVDILLKWMEQAKRISSANVYKNGEMTFFSKKVQNHFKSEDLNSKLRKVLGENETAQNIKIIYGIYLSEYVLTYSRNYDKFFEKRFREY